MRLQQTRSAGEQQGSTLQAANRRRPRLPPPYLRGGRALFSLSPAAPARTCRLLGHRARTQAVPQAVLSLSCAIFSSPADNAAPCCQELRDTCTGSTTPSERPAAAWRPLRRQGHDPPEQPCTRARCSCYKCVSMRRRGDRTPVKPKGGHEPCCMGRKGLRCALRSCCNP